MEEVTIMTKLVQLGFAGFCLLLLGIVWWLLKFVMTRVETLLASLVDAVSMLNVTMREMKEETREQRLAAQALQQAVMNKPCLLPREHHR